MSKKNFRSHIEARREAAKVRQVERSKRDNVDQLTALTVRGHGHCKEAKKLFAQLNKQVQDKLNNMVK